MGVGIWLALRSRAIWARLFTCNVLSTVERAVALGELRQASHSPTMTLSTYAHLFNEAAGAERVSAEDEIRRARQLVKPGATYLIRTR